MNNTIICSNLTTGTDSVTLIPNQEIKNVYNLGNYRLILACNIPEATANYPVFIQVGEAVIPLLCRYGNTVLANQLNRRVNYFIGFGNQNESYTDGQFTIQNTKCLNPRGTEG
jgi:hypothetical protein